MSEGQLSVRSAVFPVLGSSLAQTCRNPLRKRNATATLTRHCATATAAADRGDPDVPGILFNDISRMTADRTADHITRAVNTVWAEEVSWPDAEERQSLYGFFSSYDCAVGVMDGTHCQIEVPVVEEGEYHSFYKNFHTQNYLICADALGFVIYTAGPFGDRDNDRGAFNTRPFVQSDCPLQSEGEVVLVDGGFEGDGHVLHQFAERELMQLTSEERERIARFNEDFTHNRSPIEHCIHRVKSRAQALARRWPRALSRQAELFTAATRVYNRCRRIRMEHALQHRRPTSLADSCHIHCRCL